MMDGDHDDAYPFILESEGRYDECTSVSEFKENLTNDHLSSEKTGEGWVFWSSEMELNSIDGGNVSDRTIGEKIIIAFSKMKFELEEEGFLLVQFWVPIQVGGRCYLTTSGQPFAVKYLYKGLCSYRQMSMQHLYVVDDAAGEEQLGPPGRVFRSGHPESSPDLLFYSTKEFPLRDHAASCGLMTYLAVPVFDLNHEQCIGVLEHLHCLTPNKYPLEVFQRMHDALKVAEMRSTHEIPVAPQQPREIREMLDLTFKAVPQLHLAQVWIPCKECANISNNFNCMEQALYAHREYLESRAFRDACRFHKVQNGKGMALLAFSSENKSCFCRNLCDFSISEYPMAHYAQQARLSFCFVICLHSNDGLHVLEFFLQPQSSENTYIGSLLHLLLQIMEMKLKSFKIATGQHLGGKLAADEVLPTKNMLSCFESGQIVMLPFTFENQKSKENTMVMPIKGYSGKYSLSQFRDYFRNTDISCFKTQMKYGYGLVCWSTEGKELSEKRADNKSILLLSQIQEKIKYFFRKIIIHSWSGEHSLIQFWAPKMIGNRSCLSSSDQPFALVHLHKGLCWYRKQCMEYPYFVGDGAKDEDLGPPGRTFLKGHPESSHDLRLYSTKEFPLRDHIFHLRSKRYLAIPLFDSHHEQCLGVLEFVGTSSAVERIAKLLEATSLRSTRFNYNYYSCFNASNLLNSKIARGQQLAFTEIDEMLEVVIKSPQLVAASVWIPCDLPNDIDVEMSCFKLAKFSVNLLKDDRSAYPFSKACESLEVKTRQGFMGRVLTSEYKMCLCENFCDFSIAEEPLAHYAQEAGLGVWFAICLQSAYTGSSLYVLEFILSPGSKKYEYPRSFLCSLLTIMKNKLKSFKAASGQELGRELIFQAIELGTENKRTRFEPGQMGNLPHSFETDQGDNEIQKQYSEKQIHFNGLDDDRNSDGGQEHDITCTNSEEGNASTSNRDRSNTDSHVSHKVLQSHFEERLDDALEELEVYISKLKRKYMGYDIERWQSNMKNKMNPSHFLTTSNKQVEDSYQQIPKPSGRYIPTSRFPVVQPNVPKTPIEHTGEVDKTCQETNVVMIKAKFEDDTINFQLCLSSGMERLVEEVAKRLNLKIGSFKLKYVDEEKDEDENGDGLILLTCDEDLRLYVKIMRSLGKTSLQVLVHLISD